MSAFRPEHILPDVAEGSVRLPRPAGSSTQGMAVTLVADCTLRNRAQLPSGVLVELLTELGVTAAAARTTINRLIRRGVLETSRHGRQALYRLTEPAATSLASGGRRIVSFATDAESWDGAWTFIAFSLPQEGDTQRRALRVRLRWLGYAPLYDALWVSPDSLSEKTATVLAELSLGRLTALRAVQLDIPGANVRDPLEAWDTAGIAAEYESFIAAWDPVLPRMEADGIHGAEAVRLRTAIMDSYRRFVVLDPSVPMRELPAGWLREQARDLFGAVYDGLAGAALDHIREIAARHGAEAGSGIAPHTVADLREGVRAATVGGA